MRIRKESYLKYCLKKYTICIRYSVLKVFFINQIKVYIVLSFNNNGFAFVMDQASLHPHIRTLKDNQRETHFLKKLTTNDRQRIPDQT